MAPAAAAKFQFFFNFMQSGSLAVVICVCCVFGKYRQFVLFVATSTSKPSISLRVELSPHRNILSCHHIFHAGFDADGVCWSAIYVAGNKCRADNIETDSRPLQYRQNPLGRNAKSIRRFWELSNFCMIPAAPSEPTTIPVNNRAFREFRHRDSTSVQESTNFNSKRDLVATLFEGSELPPVRQRCRQSNKQFDWRIRHAVETGRHALALPSY